MWSKAIAASSEKAQKAGEGNIVWVGVAFKNY
jgi:hypothetical protein